jgi:hypothetical protein
MVTPMNGSRDDYSGTLRREACPLAYDRLDQSQQASFRRIVQMLDHAVGLVGCWSELFL